jgi:membrane-bound serine protease (ClpP class)
VVTIALRAQHIPLRTGVETMTGKTGYAQTELNPIGLVQVAAEQWSAEAVEGEAPIARGEKVEVVAVNGLRLKVKKER